MNLMLVAAGGVFLYHIFDNEHSAKMAVGIYVVVVFILNVAGVL